MSYIILETLVKGAICKDFSWKPLNKLPKIINRMWTNNSFHVMVFMNCVAEISTDVITLTTQLKLLG